MNRVEVVDAFLIAKTIQASIDSVILPPEEISPPISEPIIAHALFKRSRGYIEKVVYQINSAYLATAYDGCAVMIRRLLETLIIEVFESKGMASRIKTTSGDYLYLRDLIERILAEPAWTLGRKTKAALPRLKDVGDLSAHNRRYNALRSDIDKVKDDLRVVSEELLNIAGLR
jgi:hypothetical protein